MNVSVVIVTKNRVHHLSQCLRSVIPQIEKGDELIIIDNASVDQTPRLIRRVQQKNPSIIQTLTINDTGYPLLYNRGLRASSHNWTIFIDDDCVAHPNWLGSFKREIEQTPDTAAFLGNSLTYYDSPFSYATYFSFLKWRDACRTGRYIHHLECLDNKNIAYNKRFLTENSIEFDESRNTVALGASEDCDLGVQIQTHGGKALFCQNALVWHKDPINWTIYRKKIEGNIQGQKGFLNKWQATGLYRPAYNQKNYFFTLLELRQLYSLSPLMIIETTIILCNTSFYRWWLKKIPTFSL